MSTWPTQPGGHKTVTLASGFKQPQGLAVDGSGGVYVAAVSSAPVKEILAVSIPPSPKVIALGSGLPNRLALRSNTPLYLTLGWKIDETCT
jgi:hypothetical protein